MLLPIASLISFSACSRALSVPIVLSLDAAIRDNFQSYGCVHAAISLARISCEVTHRAAATHHTVPYGAAVAPMRGDAVHFGQRQQMRGFSIARRYFETSVWRLAGVAISTNRSRSHSCGDATSAPDTEDERDPTVGRPRGAWGEYEPGTQFPVVCAGHPGRQCGRGDLRGRLTARPASPASGTTNRRHTCAEWHRPE